MNIFSCIAKPGIERQHSAIVLADTEANFWTADAYQKRLGPSHQFSSDATALERGCNREIIDRAAMPVVADLADHYGRNQCAA